MSHTETHRHTQRHSVHSDVRNLTENKQVKILRFHKFKVKLHIPARDRTVAGVEVDAKEPWK